MPDCLIAALRYADRGWSVFPLHGKKPFSGTNGFREATTDRKQIRQWWRRWPHANVGIACDSQNGPIVVDIDKDGPLERAFLERLNLPDTKEATSGKKTKRHLYFDSSLSGEDIARTIRPFRKNGKKIEIDILGDGGYVVAPPSVHPETGRQYRWIEKRAPARFPRELLKELKKTHKSSKKRNAERLPDLIDEGERDNLLTSLAGSMRRRGASEEGILAALREENETRVVPPLPDKDLKRIAKSIAKKEPAIAEEHMTDLGNARRFITQHEEKVRSIMSSRRPWYVWDDQRWTPDTTGEVDRMAKQTVRRLYSEAGEMEDDEKRDAMLKHAAKSESAGHVRAMMELAATEQELSTTTAQLDANLWLLNVLNGTIDLRTGVLRQHRREDLITKLASVEYDPKARAPRWKKFMLEIMNGDEELVAFLQRAVGYALTGDTREQCLFFCYGQGSNGKSTFLETIRSLFGEYAKQSDFSTFLASRNEGPRNDLARMHGARLVTASEADSERGFDGRIIKLLTGDDTIVARKLYEEYAEFKPQHKLFLAANHKPIVKEQTEGFWRRIRLIPFTVVFSKDKRDKRLGKKLLEELPGILNWAIEGCRLWRKEGLHEPEAVKRATYSYRDENDILGEFLVHSCRINPESWTSTPALYRAFSDWWVETRGPRSQPISMGWFGRLLGERPEFKPRKRQRTRGWKGVSIKINSGV